MSINLVFLEEEEEEELEDFDPQVSYTVRGRPMTTGAQDDLQLCFAGGGGRAEGGGGVVGGPLTFRGCTLLGIPDDHWSSR